MVGCLNSVRGSSTAFTIVVAAMLDFLIRTTRLEGIGPSPTTTRDLEFSPKEEVIILCAVFSCNTRSRFGVRTVTAWQLLKQLLAH